jgi:hypothetical protein
MMCCETLQEFSLKCSSRFAILADGLEHFRGLVDELDGLCALGRVDIGAVDEL